MAAALLIAALMALIAALFTASLLIAALMALIAALLTTTLIRCPRSRNLNLLTVTKSSDYPRC